MVHNDTVRKLVKDIDVAIDLSGYAEYLDNALTDNTPCIVPTADLAGNPDIGFKGSVIIYDNDHLAFWERVRGQHFHNLKENPGIAVLYSNRERGKNLRIFGRAEVLEDGPVREAIMARTPERELNADPERKGAAILIRVDRLLDPRGKVTQER